MRKDDTHGPNDRDNGTTDGTRRFEASWFVVVLKVDAGVKSRGDCGEP